MNLKAIAAALTIAVLALTAQSQSAENNNLEAILQQILAGQQQMQQDLRTLREKVERQDEEIAELKRQLQQQQSDVAQQTREVRERVEAIQANPPAANNEPSALDILAAQDQYAVARDLQHHTIFNIRRGEQQEWFERVIVEFREVVENYPMAPEADDAQIRIARTYHRYLDEPAKAREEYQKLLDNYPQSPYVEEARKRLSQLN